MSTDPVTAHEAAGGETERAAAGGLNVELVAQMWRDHAECNWTSDGTNVRWSCGILHPGLLHMQPTTRDRHLAALVMTQVEGDRIIAARRLSATTALCWPCANYKRPTTCLTAPSSASGRCEFCAAQLAAADLLRQPGSDVTAALARVEALIGDGRSYCQSEPAVSVADLRAALAAADPDIAGEVGRRG